MKHQLEEWVFCTICMLSVLFPAAGVAGEIWSIGKADSSYEEFFGAKNHEAVAEKFPNDLSVKIPDTKDFPYILPGPVDEWGGSKPHAINIAFDLPADLTEDAGCVLEIRAVGQNPIPPVLEITLNGTTQTLPTESGKTGDQILKTPEDADWKTSRIFFPFQTLKLVGNTLVIKNIKGSWIVFDSLKFQTDNGMIRSFTLEAVRGIFRGKSDAAAGNRNQDKPVRRILLKTDNILTQPLELRLVNTDKKLPPVKVKAESAKSPVGIVEIELPVDEELLTQELHFEATLKLPNKELVTKFTLPPEKKWEVHLIHQTHLDIGYTHIQEDVLKRQVQSLRDALQYIDETKDYPEEAKFRFHPEGMWAVDQFLKEATEAEKNAFLKAAKNRDLHIDGMYAQAMTGMYNEEELLELFGGAVRFCREHGIELDSVMQTDVPGYTWGLVTAMSQNGIKYMTMGPNGGHRVGNLYVWGNRPFWWVSPSGKEKVLCWMLSTGYHQFHGKPIGHIISESEIFRLLSGKYVNSWGQQGREGEQQPDFFGDLAMIRYSIEADNGRPNRALSDAVKAWNEKYLYPKLIISRNSDVMRILEQRYGDKLPTVRGDYSPYWEDGSASTSEATAINRRAKERLIQAGVLWAMFQPKGYPKTDFDAAWTDLIMYDEHTWGAYNSISAPESDFVKKQDAYKQEYARRGSRETEELVRRAAESNSNAKSNSLKTLWVNTLGWKREGICFIGKAAKDFEGTQTVRMFKTPDGKPIPVQYIADPDGRNTCSMYADLSHGDSAPNIPALSSIEVVQDKRMSFDMTSSFHVNAETGEMRSRRIHLILDKESGSIKSLKITGNSHEFVNTGSDGNQGLDDYLYIIGRNATENRQRSQNNTKRTVLAEGPLVASMLVEIDSGVPNAKSLKRQITIFNDSKNVRIENILDKKLEYKPEGTFFGFPFNIPGGKWHVDTPWASVEVEKDQIPGANRNYYCVQRYCTLANENCGVNWVTVDANMIQLEPILFTGANQLRDWRRNFEDGQPGGTLYSWVCNNHWETNYKAGQDGQLKFEYWISPYVNQAFDNGTAQRFARQIHQPVLQLPTDPLIVPRELLQWDNREVLSTSVKPSRDGGGALIVRLFNPTSQVQKTKITPTEPYKIVYQSNPFEENLKPLDNIELDSFETVTIRLE
ncbi:MAG: hypothetical protein LBQ54_06355 [Planctomycetaceae bacterium]|jgi:hypothetical protein|nr:hypothetical protein [Planctomycetaceae bacterium]